MLYDMELGCIYDTVIYGMYEFSKDEFSNYLESEYGLINITGLYIHFKLIAKIKTPKELYPFFYCAGKRWCFFSKYHYDTYNFFKNSFRDFLYEIKTNVNFKSDIFFYFLENKYVKENIPLNNPEILINNLISLDLNPELIKQLINLYYNFEKVISLLIEYLECVYEKMKHFHSTFYHSHEKQINYFSSPKVCREIVAVCNVDDDVDMKTQRYGVSFLHTYVLFYKYSKKKDFIFIVGLKSEEFILTLLDYKHIRAEWINSALAHPVKRDILNCLYEKDYSATQLAEIIYVTRQSINRHLLELNDYMVIKVVEKKNNEVFYAINYEFFKAAKIVMCKYLSKFEKPKPKLNEKKWEKPIVKTIKGDINNGKN